MYQFDDIGSTYVSLPPNLQNIENECFGYALDQQMKKFHILAKRLTIWSDLDHTDSKYYDYLAMSIRAPYYKSEYTARQKRELIKSALLTRRYAGTLKAIKELLTYTFKYASFVPWYEYEGEPYHFKIIAAAEITPESKILFGNMLQRVKAARSIIDGVEFVEEQIGTTLYIGMGIQPERMINIASGEKIYRRIHGDWYAAVAGVVEQEIKIGKGQ